MINLFINQIYEYILMGNLVSGFHRPCILLSSDHKAMAPYFACGLILFPNFFKQFLLLKMNLGLFIIPIRYKKNDSYPFDYLDFVSRQKNQVFQKYILVNI